MKLKMVAPRQLLKGQGRKTGSVTDAEKQEMQRKAEAAGTPGPAHKALEAFVGDWKAEVKCWHEKDGQPQVSQGTGEKRVGY